MILADESIAGVLLEGTYLGFSLNYFAFSILDVCLDEVL